MQDVSSSFLSWKPPCFLNRSAMRKLHRSSLLAVWGLMALIHTGCEEKVPQYQGTQTSAPATSATGSGSAAAPASKPQPARKKNRAVAPVFIDGQLRAVLTYGELPYGFEPTIVDREGDYTLCNIARYLESLGVDIAKVQGLQLEGGHRTAGITGDEVRDKKDELHFAFSRSRGTRGRPLVDWPARKVIATTRIDRIMGMHVFVEKTPPDWDKETRKYRWADGSEVEGVPYAKDFVPIKAPRLYVDGKLEGTIEDRDVPDNAIRSGDGGGKGGGNKGGGGGGKRVGLAAFLKHRGIDPKTIQAVELIGDDRVLGRYEHDAWEKHADAVTFRIPANDKKQLMMDIEEAATPFPGTAKVQAIAVYVKVEPKDRKVEAPQRRPQQK